MPTSQIILFSQPRTGCHLLERILMSKQTGAKLLSHPMTDAANTIVKWQQSESFLDADAIPSDVRALHERQMNEGLAVWEQELQNTQTEGKVLFVHDHLFYTSSPDHVRASIVSPESNAKEGGNFTLIPEELLLKPGTIPLFTIRRPVLSVPSSVKAIRETQAGGPRRPAYKIGTSLKFARELYDWYAGHDIEPVVIDADDYMTSEKFSRGLAEKLSLDPAQVAVTWGPTPEEQQAQMHPVLRAMQKTLIDSKGLVPGRAAKNVDPKEQEELWKKEFTQEEVEVMRELIEATSPDYEYLKARRFVFP